VIDAMKKDTVTLNYGTAKLRGKHFKDNVCLDSTGNRCVKNFEFLALFEAEGLSNEFDGILGLSNHKQESNNHMNFVKQLKQSGHIQKSIVSFSVSMHESYALFGEWNHSQVVNG
jgi:hypothetical protein